MHWKAPRESQRHVRSKANRGMQRPKMRNRIIFVHMELHTSWYIKIANLVLSSNLMIEGP
jgi:hypothetical protein